VVTEVVTILPANVGDPDTPIVLFHPFGAEQTVPRPRRPSTAARRSATSQPNTVGVVVGGRRPWSRGGFLRRSGGRRRKGTGSSVEGPTRPCSRA